MRLCHIGVKITLPWALIRQRRKQLSNSQLYDCRQRWIDTKHGFNGECVYLGRRGEILTKKGVSRFTLAYSWDSSYAIHRPDDHLTGLLEATCCLHINLLERRSPPTSIHIRQFVSYENHCCGAHALLYCALYMCLVSSTLWTTETRHNICIEHVIYTTLLSIGPGTYCSRQ